MSSKDRRRAERARFSGIVLVRAEDFDINCVGGDISESGMLVYPTRPPPVLPTRLHITFALPNSTRWLSADAELVWQKRVVRRTLWAVRFTAMDQETREALRTYIKENEVSDGEFSEPLPPERSTELRPVSRSATGEQLEQEIAANEPLSPGGKRVTTQAVSIEAMLPDPETLVLSSGEVDQLAAASLLVDADEELPPPPLPEDDDDEEVVEVEVEDDNRDTILTENEPTAVDKVHPLPDEKNRPPDGRDG